jgi:hypothetical protein
MSMPGSTIVDHSPVPVRHDVDGGDLDDPV